MANLKVNIDTAKILSDRGLGSSSKATVFLAETVQRLCDPYVPMAAGSGVHMKALYDIANDGATITYTAPYAHFQYTGLVMVGASGSPWANLGEKKTATNKALSYNDSPMRGKEWDKRMMADRGDEVVAAFANYVGGTAK